MSRTATSVYIIFIVLHIVLFSSCYKLEPIGQGEEEENPILEEEGVEWEALAFEAERKILNLHATPSQLYMITDNQFARFNPEGDLGEKRPLNAERDVYGQPALSDNAFVRVTKNQRNHTIIEFHLARNPAQVIQIEDVDLVRSNEHVEIEFLGLNVGAFNDTGSLFLLPTTTYPNYHYTFFLFEIRFNFAHTEILSVEIVKRIDVPQLPSDFGNLSTVRHINGNFYIATQEGGFRITEEGDVSRIFRQWVVDYFAYNDKLYATGFNTFDFYVSENNGRNWERTGQTSELKIVAVENDQVFTQEIMGRRFSLADEALTRAKKIIYENDFPTDPTFYTDMEYFNGRYYFSVHKQIYSVNKIAVE